MKVKDLLENYQGDNHIEIYDCFSCDTKRFNNKAIAIKNFGYFPVLSWTVLTTQNKIKNYNKKSNVTDEMMILRKE